jgi:uncharacterized Fe-S cluster protein YjdI
MVDSAVHHYPADGVIVTWDGSICRHFAVCVRQLPEVFDTARRPWVQPENADPARVVATVRACPSGALHIEAASGMFAASGEGDDSHQ